MDITLEALSQERGLPVDFLEAHGIRPEDGHFVIPTLHGRGVWYEREYHPGGRPKYRTPKGMHPHLYNPLGLGPHSEEVWIAEGEFDTLTLVHVGVPALGILGANAFHTAWRHLFDGARIILALDNDKAGQEAASKLDALFGGKTETLYIPSEFNDLNDWWKADRKGFIRATTGL